MSQIAEIFAKNLRKVRLDKGFTQEYLAEKIHVDPISIRNYETKRRWPKQDIIERLALALDVSQSSLFQDPDLIPAEPKAPPTVEALLAVIQEQEERIRELEAMNKNLPSLAREIVALLPSLDDVKLEILLDSARIFAGTSVDFDASSGDKQKKSAG